MAAQSRIRRLLSTLPGGWRVVRAWDGHPRGPAPLLGAPRPVVCLPTWSKWGVMQQRPQYLTAAFAAAGHDAYFVDPRPVAPFHDSGVDVVPALAHVPRRKVILYSHFAPLIEMVARFDDAVVIYDVYDDLQIFAADESDVAPDRRVAAHHETMLRRADLVVASTVEIGRGLGHDGPMLVVPNGVDLDLFVPDAPRPGDMPAPGGPIIGFHGMVSHWFDFDLVAAVADLRPDWSLVMVGPTDPRVEERMAALTARPNVVALGERPSVDIPGYVAAFDVGVLWFQVSDLTLAVSPLKMYEWMAAGVPVVAPPLPACRAEPSARIADGAEAFVAAIAEALRADEADALRTAARSASWQERLRPVLEWLDDHDLRTVAP